MKRAIVLALFLAGPAQADDGPRTPGYDSAPGIVQFETTRNRVMLHKVYEMVQAGRLLDGREHNGMPEVRR
jgi:hypothetical protein